MERHDNSRERSAFANALAAVMVDQRKDNHMSQRLMAEASGIPYGTLRRIESGDRVPDATQIARFARAIGMEPWRLMELAEQRESKDGEPEPRVVRPASRTFQVEPSKKRQSRD